MDKLQGRIKTVNSKGFGFITTEKDLDFFFHFSAFKGMSWRKLVAMHFANPSRVLKVSFEHDKTAIDGLRAVNVELVDEEKL